MRCTFHRMGGVPARRCRGHGPSAHQARIQIWRGLRSTILARANLLVTCCSHCPSINPDCSKEARPSCSRRALGYSCRRSQLGASSPRTSSPLGRTCYCPMRSVPSLHICHRHTLPRLAARAPTLSVLIALSAVCSNRIMSHPCTWPSGPSGGSAAESSV